MHYSLVRQFPHTALRGRGPLQETLHQVQRIWKQEYARGHTPTGVETFEEMQLRATTGSTIAHVRSGRGPGSVWTPTGTGRSWHCPSWTLVPTPRSPG